MTLVAVRTGVGPVCPTAYLVEQNVPIFADMFDLAEMTVTFLVAATRNLGSVVINSHGTQVDAMSYSVECHWCKPSENSSPQFGEYIHRR